MRTMTIKVPPELSAWLDERAARLNRPKSELVREALEAQRERANARSVTARAGDLVGRFASGRRDASNKKYLKGFGS